MKRINLFLLCFALSFLFVGAKISDNTLRMGDGTPSTNKQILMGNGQLRWAGAEGKLKFSNDNGGSYKDIGTGGSGQAGFNMMSDKNFDFESGNPPVNWSASGGTFTAEATDIAFGSQSGSWNPSAAAQTLLQDAAVIPKGFYGRNGLGQCLVKTLATDLKMQVYDGANVLSEITVQPATEWTAINSPFVFPVSGNLRIRFLSQSDSAVALIDNCYIGENFLVGQVQVGMELVGDAYMFPTAGCSWGRTSGTFGAFSADGDCPDWTVVRNPGPGTISASGHSDFPRLLVQGLLPGRYLVNVYGQINDSAASSACVVLRENTTSFSALSSTNCNEPDTSTSKVTSFSLSGIFDFTSAGDRQFELWGASAGGTIGLVADAGGKQLGMQVYRIPTNQETGIRLDQSAWKIDANISGSNASLGTAAVSSYAPITDGGLTLVQNSGSASVLIPCSVSNDSSGTTCSAGDEQIGIAFTPPFAGDYLACASFGHFMDVGAGGDVNATFQIVETPNTAETISQQGKSRINSSSYRSTGAGINGTTPLRLCGNFTFASVGKKTLRLMYEQTVTATISSNRIMADVLASNGQRDIHWEVYPVNPWLQSPLLVNSVVSPSLGVERIARAIVNCQAASTIISQADTWLSSIGNISGGACSLVIAAGTFSATPTCVASDHTSTAGTPNIVSVRATSATAFSIDASDNAGAAATNWEASIVCTGPK